MASGSGWNLWVWLESLGVVSRRWVCVETMSVASGCGCMKISSYYLWCT